jgi:hypothetical protein
MITSVTPTKPSSPILRCLPGRLVLAWAVLGAAAAVGLMYVPAVYEGRSSGMSDELTEEPPVFLSRIGMFFTEGRVRVLGEVVCEGRSQDPGEIYEAIDRWHTRVAGRLAAIGAILGALVGWREQRRWRRRPVVRRRGGWLWLPASVAVFSVLAVAGVPGENALTLWREWRWEMRVAETAGVGLSWKELWDLHGGVIVRLAMYSVAIGWAVHVAAGARGVRLSFGRRPEQAADYGEDG